MGKPARLNFHCAECGWTTSKWVGQCRECRAWGTLEEQAPAPIMAGLATAPGQPARPIREVDANEAAARATGVGELDRVLGGGIVPGAVVLLAGEPGVGKSTLLLDVAARAAQQAEATGLGPVLYLSGEESAAQVRLRAQRIGALADQLLLAAESSLAAVLGHVDQANPSLLVIDSVQTITADTAEGAAGGVTQVRAVASALISLAKERGLPVLLVGHVTKDGSIAGPRMLEHLVDVVLQFEGDRHTRLRLLRALKNRYGPTDEVGCFDLGEEGIVGLADPAGLFLSATGSDVPGTCVCVTLEGRRPIPTEVQALVAPAASAGSARRVTSGLDSSRVAMTLAVLQARLGLDLAARDIYVSTVGGAKTTEPAADLAIALAVVSAAQNLTPPDRLVALGEVGLTGEVRATAGIARRLTEAARLGFRRAIIPSSGSSKLRVPPNMQVIPVASLPAAIAAGFAAEGANQDSTTTT